MNAPIIFVDIDGVLCTSRARDATRDDCDPIAFGLLSRIARSTGARIVVISARRTDMDHVRRLFARHDMADLIHDNPCTGIVAGRTRGADIDDWMDDNGMTSYVILDDDLQDYRGPMLARTVHVNPNIGLTRQDMRRAIATLSTGVFVDDGVFKGNSLSDMARSAIDAIDQGDLDAARSLLDIVANHPAAL